MCVRFCMAFITAQALSAGLKICFVTVSALGGNRFSYKRQLFISQEDGFELAAYDAQANVCNHCSIRALHNIG